MTLSLCLAVLMRFVPDYAGVTMPVNIAPLNFDIDGLASGRIVTVTCRGADGSSLRAHTTWRSRERVYGVRFRQADWRAFLSGQANRRIETVVTVDDAVERVVTNAVLAVRIDPGLTFRLIEPTYVLAGPMEIRWRCLESFEEKILRRNLDADRSQCINCHTPGPEGAYLYHARIYEPATHVHSIRWGDFKADLTAGNSVGGGAHASWHPSGRFFAITSNKTRQLFPLAASEDPIIVYDLEGDLKLYDLQERRVSVVEDAYNVLECYPAWSSDGRYLYTAQAVSPFKSRPAPGMDPSPEEVLYLATNLHYAIVRRLFDAATKSFSPPETVVASAGCSFTFPRPSPDGRWLVASCAPFGVFPLYHQAADLWLLDLTRNSARPLHEINSPEAESYHGFDSSGRWFVFNSRRDDGAFTRPYFAAFDPVNGRFTKPFKLPVENPCEHLRRMKSYNVPEFDGSTH